LKGKFFFVGFFLMSYFGLSQQSSVQDTLLVWIASQQVVSDTFYNKGHFKSQRIYKKDRYEDNTLFYSTLIAHTLDDISAYTPNEQKAIIDTIYHRVRKNTWRNRSRRGRPTYNFWQSNPDIAHPNGPAKYQQDKYKIPDDFDDTSTIGLMLDDEKEVSDIRQEMIRYTADRKKNVRTTFNRFKKSEAFGVWYADKWKQEFDFCVMVNTLLFIFENNFELTQYDSATVKFIHQSISQNLHKRHPYVLSPYYNRTPVILYHLVKLMEKDTYGFFTDIKPKVIEDINDALQKKQPEIHKVILYSSLLKLGKKPTDLQLDSDKLKNQVEKFYWFSSNFMVAVGTRTFLRKLLNDSKIVPTFYWRCDAFYWTLYLEYLVLSDR